MEGAEWRDIINELKQDIRELKSDVKTIMHEIGELQGKIEEMQRKNALVKALMKYVVLPLIFILGGLVGIKLVLPGM